MGTVVVKDFGKSAMGRMTMSEAVAVTVAVAALLIGSSSLVKTLLSTRGFETMEMSAIAGLVSAIVVMAFLCGYEAWRSRLKVNQALCKLGFKGGTFPQARIALLGVIPILIGYMLIFFYFKKSPEVVPSLGLVILKFIVAQGFAEEVVFRGFLFRHLRADRSFWRASSLSAVLFALVHLANFSKGFSSAIVIGVLISIAFGFLLTYPLCLLFEIGMGSILGGAILHTAIDSINWFTQAGEPASGLLTYLSSVLVTEAVVTLLSVVYIEKFWLSRETAGATR